MKSFRGKKALIVGGSEGIGEALAHEFLREGAKVMIASRSADKLEAAQQRLIEAGARADHVAIQAMDITIYEGLRTKVEIITDDWGVPDILVNSAGIAHPRYLENITHEEMDQMIDLNFRGTVYVNQIFCPKMAELKEAQVLNVSSVAGYVGLFGYTVYCGSKAAVIAFSEALREEYLHTGLKVSVLCPPNTKTPGLEKENEKKPQEVLATEEKAKVLEPEEVAKITVQQLKKNQFMIIPTFDSQMAMYLKRFAPAILRRFVRRPN